MRLLSRIAPAPLEHELECLGSCPFEAIRQLCAACIYRRRRPLVKRCQEEASFTGFACLRMP